MCWVSKVYRVCKKLGYDWCTEGPQGTDALCEWLLRTGLPIGSLLGNFANMLMGEWKAESICADPRAFPESGGHRNTAGGPGVKMCRYTQWMGVPQLDAAVKQGILPHMKEYVTHKHLMALIRFRLGCWDIEVNRPVAGGRYRPRNDRVCRLCRGGVEDDKKRWLSPAREKGLSPSTV